jgi:hypothetical protein
VEWKQQHAWLLQHGFHAACAVADVRPQQVLMFAAGHLDMFKATKGWEGL